MKKFVLILTIATVLIGIDNNLPASVPRVISYQGLITDSQGNPKQDGVYTITFTLYSQASAGSSLWTETKQLNLSGGLFMTLLGDLSPMNNLSFNEQYWLGIMLQGEPEMTPRVRLSSAPYSIRSQYADTAEYAKNGGTIFRPLNPPITKNEISGKTVVRSIAIYPVPFSDSVSVMRDSIYLIGGTNVNIRQNRDSIIINSTGGSDSSGGTLDQAYDFGGNGNGRTINADAGRVEILADDGLYVTGTNNALTVETSIDIPAAHIIHLGTGGDAIFAEIKDATSPFAAIRAESFGDMSSSAVYGIAKGEGLGGFFEVQNVNSKSEALKIGNLGLGSAVTGYIYNKESSVAVFETLVKDNPYPTVKATNNGPGYGGLFTSMESPSIQPWISGVAGVSRKYTGVYGYSEDSTGVYGSMNKAGTYALTQRVTAGVVGESGNVSTADNFGVAGVAAGYGTGVIGIGSGAGHGVYGVSGNNSKYTSAGVRGITRENDIGEFIGWPPYIPLEEYMPYNKNRVGVLGQAVYRVGVWGESFHRFGVVGNTGLNIGWDDLPGDSAGVLGLAYQSKGIAVLGISKQGYAGKFVIKEQTNTEPALWIETAGTGEAAYFWLKNQQSFDPTVYINNAGLGSALYMQNTNTSNSTPTLHITNNGVGRTLSVGADNAASSSSALFAYTSGLGRVGDFQILNTSSGNSAFYIDTKGLGRVLNLKVDNAVNDSNVFYASTNGRGRVGEFNIFNSTNPAPALYVSTTGTGNAGYFKTFNTSTATPTMIVQTSGTGYALVVYGAGNPAKAASFSGNVDVFGNLSKSSGNFRIDHPLDPANKYLNHSFVESPDMKNIYDGIAVMDGSGEAEVTLPEWFDALNIDLRYQLTSIGSPAPGLFISQEVINNKFRIAGGNPGQKVSWQVTGTRNDPYARENRIQVEVMKTEEQKGMYLYPEMYSNTIQPSMPEENTTNDKVRNE